MKILTPLTFCFWLVYASHGPSALAVQQEINQTYDLAAGGSISLDNTNGSVTINAWDQAKVQVHAVKKGRSQSDMDAVRIDISHDPQRLSIRTIYPKLRFSGGNTSVSYTLLVPRKVNLSRIESVNGSIKISDVQGSLNAKTVNGSVTVLNSAGSTDAGTVNGSITVELDRVEPNKPMRFETTNGSITVYLPENMNAEVRAHTTNGSIRSDFPLTVQGKFTSKNIRGTLGKGGPLLSLGTVNGSIKLLMKRGAT